MRLVSGRDVLRAGDVADPLVAEAGDVLDRQPDPLTVVDRRPPAPIRPRGCG